MLVKSRKNGGLDWNGTKETQMLAGKKSFGSDLDSVDFFGILGQLKIKIKIKMIGIKLKKIKMKMTN